VKHDNYPFFNMGLKFKFKNFFLTMSQIWDIPLSLVISKALFRMLWLRASKLYIKLLQKLDSGVLGSFRIGDWSQKIRNSEIQIKLTIFTLKTFFYLISSLFYEKQLVKIIYGFWNNSKVCPIFGSLRLDFDYKSIIVRFTFNFKVFFVLSYEYA